MNSSYHKLKEILFDLETELRQKNLWEPTKPSSENLANTQPFCINTLKFEQWLQWVFIPKINTAIDDDLPLPANSQIEPMIDVLLKDRGFDTNNIRIIISRFDTLINSQ